MKNENERTEASRKYAAAYAAHYSEHDLPLAFQLYKNLMVSHSDAQETAYSQAQVQNIVKAVVPKEELPDAQLELVHSCWKRSGSLDNGRSPIASLATKLPTEASHVLAREEVKPSNALSRS